MMKTTIIYILISLLFLISCNYNKSESGNILEFREVEFSNSAGDCEQDDDVCIEITINYQLVEIGPGQVVDSINHHIHESISTSLAGFIADSLGKSSDFGILSNYIIRSYEDFREEFTDYANKWYVEIRSYFLRNDESICSMCIETNSYMGGAHGNDWLEILNFDSQTGKKISWKDLINDQNKFIHIAEKAFREDNELANDADLNEEGYFFENNRYRLPENIGLSKDGILFLYNTYEIAPYFMGRTSYTISWDQLEGLLNEEWEDL